MSYAKMMKWGKTHRKGIRQAWCGFHTGMHEPKKKREVFLKLIAGSNEWIPFERMTPEEAAIAHPDATRFWNPCMWEEFKCDGPAATTAKI